MENKQTAMILYTCCYEQEQVGHGIFMEYGVCEPLYRFGSYWPSEDMMSILESDEKREVEEQRSRTESYFKMGVSQKGRKTLGSGNALDSFASNMKTKSRRVTHCHAKTKNI